MRIGVVWGVAGWRCVHTSLSKNPAEAGFSNKLKLTDKPRSFIESGVDSHSSLLAQIAKTPPKRGFLRS
ncbi:hypothetical protein CIW65_21180 [Enterobacter cloacae]|nr:hypothetical protein CIW65_21180 [Enterobacter cloacae]